MPNRAHCSVKLPRPPSSSLTAAMNFSRSSTMQVSFHGIGGTPHRQASRTADLPATHPGPPDCQGRTRSTSSGKDPVCTLSAANGQRPSISSKPPESKSAPEVASEPSEALAEELGPVALVKNALLAGVSDDPAQRGDDAQARWLLAHLLEW